MLKAITDPSSDESGSKTAAMVFVALALIASSAEPLIVKLGFRSDATPIQLLFLKILAGGFMVLPFVRFFRWVGFSGLKKMGLVCAMFTITNLLIFLSLEHLSAVMVITIVTTTPAFVALVNQWRGRDLLGIRFWAGFILSFTGVILTIQLFKEGGLGVSSIGIFYIFASVLTSTLYRTTMDDVTHEFSPIVATNYIFLSNGILALLCLPFIPSIPKEAIPTGIWLGFAGVGANIAFLAALKILGSTRISIFSILQRP